MKTKIQKINVRMPDGFCLSVNLFVPVQAKALVMVCSAAGVPQYYYFGIANYLAQKNYAVMTYDCRGIAASAPPKYSREFEAGIKQLSEDFECLIDWANVIFEGTPLAILGHSLGGILLVLAQNNHRFSAIFTVGTQMAYYKDWGFSKVQLAKIYFHWHVLLPLLTRVFGYFPGKTLKIGIENLPASLVRDIHSRRKFTNIFEFLKEIGMKSHHLQICCPVMALTMADDAICTPKALNRFFDELQNASLSKVILSPTEANVQKIGHLAFFKRKFADTLWHKVGDWFDVIYAKECVSPQENISVEHSFDVFANSSKVQNFK